MLTVTLYSLLIYLKEAEQKLELEAQLDGREEIDRDRIRDHFYEAANFSQEWPAWENLSNPQRELYFTQLQASLDLNIRHTPS